VSATRSRNVARELTSSKFAAAPNRIFRVARLIGSEQVFLLYRDDATGATVTLEGSLHPKGVSMITAGFLFMISLLIALVLLSMLRPSGGAAGHKQ
jgi:hypothetical protein